MFWKVQNDVFGRAMLSKEVFFHATPRHNVRIVLLSGKAKSCFSDRAFARGLGPVALFDPS